MFYSERQILVRRNSVTGCLPVSASLILAHFRRPVNCHGHSLSVHAFAELSVSNKLNQFPHRKAIFTVIKVDFYNFQIVLVFNTPIASVVS